MITARVHATPPSHTNGDVCVIIDVLRWTTTSLIALSNGAAGIEAFSTPEAARIRADEIGALTAGERSAHRIPGFDLGNSPTEFTPERVEGRVICATTTNGTNALLAAQGAARVFLAAFLNLSATASAIRALAPREVEIICAGSEGQPSPEDSACADALAAVLRGESLGDPTSVLDWAPHAAHLRALGYERDVEIAAAMDSVGVVAGLEEGRVVLVR